jgi:oligosaccharide repeat unit polymerase
MNAFEGYPGVELYQGFFKRIPPQKLLLYTYITLSWLPAFYLGHFLFSVIKPVNKPLQKFAATPLSVSISYIGIILFIVLLLFAYLGRNSLFGGYATYDEAARGKLSTLLVLYNFLFIYQLVSVQKKSFVIISGLLITAFLLLSMGGRMYVMQSFLIFLIFKTSFAAKRWSPGKIAGFALAGFVVASFIGLRRMGSNLNFEKALYSLFAEPVFTWFSASTYLISNDIPLINFPANFLTSFFNLIPNTIIELRPYIVSTGQMAKGYQSPLGADSLWTNIVINFGIIGSFVFVFITGFLLNMLRYLSTKSRFAATYYILVCGMLPFQLFRDGFYLLNKQLFFNFLFLPALLLTVIKLLLYLQSDKEQENETGTNAGLILKAEN